MIHLLRYAFALMLLIILTSCIKSQNEKVFIIKKGHHYSDNLPKLVRNKLEYDVKFDASCAYTIDKVEQADINKVFGFNSCTATHDYQSARFGWRWYNDSLQIFYYVYNQGKREYGYLTTLKIGEFYRLKLEQTAVKYVFTVNNVVYEHKKVWNCNAPYNYHLWPYFGGNTPAPHDIIITFK